MHTCQLHGQHLGSICIMCLQGQPQYEGLSREPRLAPLSLPPQAQSVPSNTLYCLKTMTEENLDKIIEDKVTRAVKNLMLELSKAIK